MRRRWSLKVGEIAGIEIRLHASMLLLVWLIGLYAAEDKAGLAGATVWVSTIFLGVLVHEFAHSLVARRLGIRVTEIELLPIGGMSKMPRLPDNPSHELAIALAGPATSIAIGLVVLGAVAIGQSSLPAPNLTDGALAIRIGWFNLIIGAFNLLPALPLDGGRVLRALLERREGPLRATHHAARIARVLAWALMLVGAFTNVFLMIVGLFVHVVSRSEELQAEVHHGLEGIHVADLMVRNPIVVADSATVGDVRALLRETTQRQFPVIAADGYVGLVDARRLIDVVSDTPVSAVLLDVAPTRPAANIEDTGLLTGTDALPVIDAYRRVVGLIRADDVMLVVQNLLARPASATDRAER